MTEGEGAKQLEKGRKARPVQKGPRSRTVLTPETMDALEASSGTAVRAFLLLRWHRGIQSGEAYPSIGLMCRRLSISKPTALRALEELEAAGLIARRIARGRPTVYTFPLEETGITHDTTSKGGGVTGDTGGGVAGEPKWSHPCNPTGITREYLNGDIERSKERGGAPPPSSGLLEDLIRLARARKVQGTDRQLRERVDGWLAARGEAEVRRILELPEIAGADVLHVQDMYFKLDRKTASKPSKPPDPKCRRCSGSGRAPNPVYGGTYACGCTELQHNPRG